MYKKNQGGNAPNLIKNNPQAAAAAMYKKNKLLICPTDQNILKKNGKGTCFISNSITSCNNTPFTYSRCGVNYCPIGDMTVQSGTNYCSPTLGCNFNTTSLYCVP